MRDVLFLTQRMCVGFGVGVVVHELAVQLLRRGYRPTVGCFESDGTFEGYNIEIVGPELRQIRALVNRLQNPVVIAHTSPFFELLPDLTGSCECWAWEHGDPTPSFFEGDAADRANVQRHKIQHVYPVLRGVVAISEFIRHDIQAPGAIVIPNGCDHAPDLGSKNLQDLPADPAAPLRLGTLMRLGSGEARYKGNALFVELCRRLKALGVAVEPHVMGRGLPSDAAPFEEQGIRVHLNAPDAEKWTYLRGLDVFMSCSQWEGFNLPLVEAEAVGTIGMAFDTGAHPEVTPFVVSSLDEAVELVRALAVNRTHLLESSRRSYQFARSRFRWADAADALINTVLSGDGVPPSKRHSAGAAPRLSPLLLARKGIRALRDEGVAATTAKGARFVWKRLNRP